METITVHHLERSRSHRVLWLLAELDLPYEMVTHKRHPKTMRAPKSMRDIHPLGKAPMVTVGDQVLAESGAILEYFVEATGKLGAPDGATQDYRYWMHYPEGSLMPPLLVKLITSQLRTGPVPFFLKPIGKAIAGKIDENYTDPELDLHLEFLEGHLEQNEYFCGGAFTAADIQMSYPIEAALAGSGTQRAMTRTRAWVARIQERPGYQKAVEVGGPNLMPGR